MFLIVGLGNPGAEYVGTRHNVGFRVADALAAEYGFAPFRTKFDGLITEGKIGGEKVYLLKPQTYMNLSGNAVVKAAAFYKILPENIVVIHDDMDLPAGKIKAKLGGGTGGHNGLKSIDAAVTSGYNRIRLGVGHPAGHGAEVIGHVLSRFGKADSEAIDQAVATVIDHIGVLLQNGVNAFSNQIGMLQTPAKTGTSRGRQKDKKQPTDN